VATLERTVPSTKTRRRQADRPTDCLQYRSICSSSRIDKDRTTASQSTRRVFHPRHAGLLLGAGTMHEGFSCHNQDTHTRSTRAPRAQRKLSFPTDKSLASPTRVRRHSHARLVEDERAHSTYRNTHTFGWIGSPAGCARGTEAVETTTSGAFADKGHGRGIVSRSDTVEYSAWYSACYSVHHSVWCRAYAKVGRQVRCQD